MCIRDSVISVGPDQNTQQFYFHPEKRKPEYEGAGGVPLRTREEFEALKAATKFGNQPLIRCYSGTADVFDMAQLLKDTLNNAWCAVPLCWYNKLDGRGDRDIDTSVKEAVELCLLYTSPPGGGWASPRPGAPR